MQPEHQSFTLANQAGYIWTWWKNDPLPLLPPLPNFSAEEATDLATLATLMELSPTEVTHLLQQSHRPYLAHLGTQPVAVGWSATGRAEFGGGRANFRLPPLNRYLYYFITLPTHRGLGIYPHLLQHILTQESRENDRFWIVHQLENIASQRGIHKAGFRIACHVHHLPNEQLALLLPSSEDPGAALERAHAASVVFRLPLIEESSGHD